MPNQRLHLAYQLAECLYSRLSCESFGIPIAEALARGCSGHRAEHLFGTWKSLVARPFT